MSGFWLIARHEYRKKVRERAFFIVTLAVPVIMALFIAVMVFNAMATDGSQAIGVVDPAGILISPGEAADLGIRTTFIAIPDVAAARQAVMANEVRAVYMLALDYRESGTLALLTGERGPNETMQADFEQLVRVSLLKAVNGEMPGPALRSPQFIIRSLDGSREFNTDNFINIILPYFAGFAFIFIVLMTAGTLLKVVAEEKENRTIEILVTTISPRQLIGGKTVGVMAVCLTQIAIWFLAVGVGLAIGAQFFEPLRQTRVPWDMLLMLGLFFVPSYALVAALMTGIGGAAGEMRQGQQVAGIVNLLFVLPLMLSGLLVIDPNGPLAVFLSFFPTTAFAALAIRWTFVSIPLWQLVGSWLLLVASAVLTLLASARIFELGMLMYGNGLSLKAALHALTGSRSAAQAPRRNADA